MDHRRGRVTYTDRRWRKLGQPSGARISAHSDRAERRSARSAPRPRVRHDALGRPCMRNLTTRFAIPQHGQNPSLLRLNDAQQDFAFEVAERNDIAGAKHRCQLINQYPAALRNGGFRTLAWYIKGFGDGP